MGHSRRVLVRIPQYYNAIHAYGDTILTKKDRDRFYNDCSLYEWELQMKINNGNGLPAAGFFEMKQEIYEIAWKLRVVDHKGQITPEVAFFRLRVRSLQTGKEIWRAFACRLEEIAGFPDGYEAVEEPTRTE